MLIGLPVTGWTKVLIPLVVALVVAAVFVAYAGGDAKASTQCKSVNGHLDSVAVDLDGNPATLETAGTLIGGIQASFEFRDFIPVPAGNPNVPSVFFYTGAIELTLKDGSSVKGVDSGVLDFNTGELTELTTFIEKDGISGFFGRITVVGVFDLAEGVGDSDYSGEVCFGG